MFGLLTRGRGRILLWGCWRPTTSSYAFQTTDLCSPVINKQDEAELKAKAAEIVQRLAIPVKGGQAKAAKNMLDDMAAKCNVGNALVSVEKFRQGLAKLKPKQVLALRLLADRDLGANNGTVMIILGLNSKMLMQWSQEPIFAYLLRALTLGYRLNQMKPLIVEVIVEGLNRTYPNDIHDKDTGEVLHKAGERIHDGVTLGYVKEGKAFCGVAELTSEVAAPDAADAKKQENEMEEFLLRHPEVRKTLVNSIKAAEDSAPVAVAENGSPVEKSAT